MKHLSLDDFEIGLNNLRMLNLRTIDDLEYHKDYKLLLSLGFKWVAKIKTDEINKTLYAFADGSILNQKQFDKLMENY